ncbi:MAG: hypothetical protein J1E39_05690 [Eubacterium sp.]|nr:hypothetical protein [Eubacterium sp.]
MKKIVFFLQTKKPIGGSQILFLDLAAYIAQHYSDYETYYINYQNDIVEEMYKDTGIHFLDVEECDYSQFEDATFFIAVNYALYLSAKIKDLKNATICAYFYHPHVFSWLQNQIYYRKQNNLDLLELLSKTDAYCFMDDSNYLPICKLCDLNFNRYYLPVTVHSKDIQRLESYDFVKKDTISFGWLGRLDRDKIYSIINLADNLMDIQTDKKIEFHILGDGNSRSFIKIAKYSPKIQFIFTSYMYGSERDKYMKEHIDIVMAMGISAIDAAVLGIPTIVPIVSPTAFNDDKFVYIYDIQGYSLGWDPNDLKELGYKYHRLKDVISDVYDNGKKEEIGKKCAEFTEETFSLKRGAELLIENVERTKLTMSELKKNKTIKSTLRFYGLYKKIRKHRDFPMYHLFIARLNRIRSQKGLRKISYLFKEAKNTRKYDKAKDELI